MKWRKFKKVRIKTFFKRLYSGKIELLSTKVVNTTCLSVTKCKQTADKCKKITMLQKLSKCEVKAWLCWNLIILLPPWFYVKSNFGEFKQSKNVIFGNFRGSEFSFLVNLSTFQVPNLLKFKVQTVWIHQNWISRKIGVSVKWSNFKKVKHQLHILKVSRAQCSDWSMNSRSQ